MTENEISYIIRGCIFKVCSSLGPGLPESDYTMALQQELTKAGLPVKAAAPLHMIYESCGVDIGYRVDLMTDDLVIIEVKFATVLLPTHQQQPAVYARLAGLKTGLLVNLNCDDNSKNIFRKINTAATPG